MFVYIKNLLKQSDQSTTNPILKTIFTNRCSLVLVCSKSILSSHSIWKNVAIKNSFIINSPNSGFTFNVIAEYQGSGAEKFFEAPAPLLFDKLDSGSGSSSRYARQFYIPG